LLGLIGFIARSSGATGVTNDFNAKPFTGRQSHVVRSSADRAVNYSAIDPMQAFGPAQYR
jgi:hypothetical protein